MNSNNQNDQFEGRRNAARAEKQRQAMGKLKCKGINYSWGCQLIKFEKKCFGWHYTGNQITDEEYSTLDRDSNGNYKENKHHNITKTAYFERPVVWPMDGLFVLTELLSNILSFFRRILISLSPLVAIGLIIISSMDDVPGELLEYVLIAYVVAIFGSIALALFGAFLKKTRKLEEKCDKILDENGFAIWSENEEAN